MTSLKICGNLADRLFSRGFGVREKKCLKLSWEEALYLCEKGILRCEFEEILDEASSHLADFDIRYLVYRDLKNRGYVLRVKEDHFQGKKSYSMSFYPLSDMDYFDPDEILNKNPPLILSIVDGDGDITYYMVEIHEPRGEYFNFPTSLNAKYYGRRYFVFEELEQLERSTYGRREGRFGHLSLLEARYLGERGLIHPVESSGEEIYKVYRDLRERGLIVKSGFKYGTHFRVYERSMEEHSRYLVHVIFGKEELQKVSRAVRVAHGVRKELLLAYIKEKEIKYFRVSWIRP
mgnify:CR=1 FL=1